MFRWLREYRNWKVDQSAVDGLEVYSIHRRRDPMFRAIVRINAGSFAEMPGHKRGVAHFVEHLSFAQDGDLMSAFKRAKAIYADINASTNQEEICFTLTVPNTNWVQGINLLSDIILRPAISAETVEKERAVILREIQERQFGIPLHAVDNARRAVFSGNQEFSVPVIGHKEHVRAIEAQDIIAFRRQFFVRENTQIVMSSSVSHRTLRDEIRRKFYGMPHGTVYTPPLVSGVKSFGLVELPPLISEDVKSYLSFSLSNSLARKDLMMAGLVGLYLTDINAPAMAEMRLTDGLVYSLSARPVVLNHSYSFELSFTSAPEEVEGYLTKLVRHLKAVAVGDVDVPHVMGLVAKEVRAREDLLRRYSIGIDGISAQLSLHGDYLPQRKYVRMARRVTKDDFIACARSILTSPASYFAMGNTREGISEDAFRKVMKPLTLLR